MIKNPIVKNYTGFRPKDLVNFFYLLRMIYKAKHPVKYGFIVALGILALIGPTILYATFLYTMNIGIDVPVGLGLLGTFIIGIGLFNFVSIILNQYLGHLVSIVSFILGGILVIINMSNF